MKEFLPNRLARLKRDLQIKLEIKAFPKCNIIIQDKFSEKQLKVKADTTGMASVMIPYRGDWTVTTQYQGYEISDEIQCGSYGEDYFLDLTKTCSLTIQTDEGNLIELINGDEKIEAVAINGSFNEIVQGGTWTLIVKDADNADLKIMTRFEIPLDQREAIKELYFPTISISGDNTNISVERGNISLNKIMNGGTVKFKVIPGVWIVKSSLGGDKDEKIVEVNEIGVNYEVELYFPEVTIKTDAGNWVEISESEKIIASGIVTNGEFKAKLGRGNWKVRSCLNDNKAIYVEDEFEIENLEENKEVELYLSTIQVNTNAWKSIRIEITNYDIVLQELLDENGSCVFKVPVGTWEIVVDITSKPLKKIVVSHHSQSKVVNFDCDFTFGVGLIGGNIYRIKDSLHTWANPYYEGARNYKSYYDNIMPWKGMKIVERDAGTMVAIPKFWYKIYYPTPAATSIYIEISNQPREGFHVSPAHMDRKDGKGERDVVYISRYKLTFTSGVKCSRTRMTAHTFETISDAYSVINTIKNKYHDKLNDNTYLSDFNMRFTLWLLFLVEFGVWDVSQVVGIGGGASKNSSGIVNDNGYTDEMPYHTGTIYSSRTKQGPSTQYRNIEGLWDNSKEWIGGCYNDPNGFNIILDPDFPNWVIDRRKGTLVGKPSSGFPEEFKIYNNPFPLILPYKSYNSNTKNAYSTYDQWIYKSQGNLIGGGSYLQQYLGRYGLFYIGCAEPDKKSKLTGIRLMELP